MRSAPSMTSLAALDVVVPTLSSAMFFFLVIELFGLWFALAGVVIAVFVALAVLIRVPAEVDTPGV
jgi:hypothetical protein